MIFNKAFEIKNWMTEELINRPSNFVRTFGLNESTGFFNAIGSNNINNNINGISLGIKGSKNYIINILLSSKSVFNKTAIARYFRLDAADVNIRNVGSINIQRRIRPIVPGSSMAHYQVTAGTFGCVVQDSSKEYFLLSNNHVFANSNYANIGDIILQPGSSDGGNSPNDEVAYLQSFAPIDYAGINSIDAALAVPTEDFHTEILRIGQINGITNPLIGMKVKKYGRTTGYTTGRIITRNADIKVNYGGNALVQFEDQFEVEGIGRQFSQPGDSGSLVVELNTNKAVGLLFAGNQAGTTFVNPINKVLETFDATIA